MRIALYQPDIPGNTGTILRLAACLGLQVDIIEPAGLVHSRVECHPPRGRVNLGAIRVLCRTAANKRTGF